jgi:putative transposase
MIAAPQKAAVSTQPMRSLLGVAPGLVADFLRTRAQLITENALLRQQLIVAARAVKRPTLRRHERGLLVLLAAFLPRWRDAVLLVKPETILRWHRAGFRLFWRWRSRSLRAARPRPCLAERSIDLIYRMARENRLWGAERIRGELLKLGIRVSKRTVQKYMRGAPKRPPAHRAILEHLPPQPLGLGMRLPADV